MSLPSSFPVPVEGIGEFVFRRRMPRDQLAIEGRARKTAGGSIEEVGGEIMGQCLAIETLAVLTISAPEGWDMDALDPLNDECWRKINTVFQELRKAEGRFRGVVPAQPAGLGEGAKPVD